jgi:TPR repeat protein
MWISWFSNFAFKCNLYRYIVDHGDAPAQSQMGAHLLHGDGVAKDEAAAVRCYHMAAA